MGDGFFRADSECSVWGREIDRSNCTSADQVNACLFKGFGCKPAFVGWNPLLIFAAANKKEKNSCQ